MLLDCASYIHMIFLCIFWRLNYNKNSPLRKEVLLKHPFYFLILSTAGKAKL